MEDMTSIMNIGAPRVSRGDPELSPIFKNFRMCSPREQG